MSRPSELSQLVKILENEACSLGPDNINQEHPVEQLKATIKGTKKIRC